jgi:hypothetical protein
MAGRKMDQQHFREPGGFAQAQQPLLQNACESSDSAVGLDEHGAETLGGVISRERNTEDLDVVMSVAGCYDETTMIVCVTEEVYTGSV